MRLTGINTRKGEIENFEINSKKIFFYCLQRILAALFDSGLNPDILSEICDND